MSVWHKLRLAPPSVADLLGAEPLLRHIDPDLVANGLALLEECSHEMDPLIVLMHCLQRRRLGPAPVCRLLVRALLVLVGRKVRPLTFAQAFRPGRQSPPTMYPASEVIFRASDEEAA